MKLKIRIKLNKEKEIRKIFKIIEKESIKKTFFYLDNPLSNKSYFLKQFRTNIYLLSHSEFWKLIKFRKMLYSNSRGSINLKSNVEREKQNET